MSADPDSKPILEDDCAICGKWPARDRRALRKMIRALPVNEGPNLQRMLAELLAWACRASGAGAAEQTFTAGAAIEMWWLFQVAPVVVLSHRLDIHPV